jgi:hypothetical protein
LDPDHNLNCQGFKEQLKIRKATVNAFQLKDNQCVRKLHSNEDNRSNSDNTHVSNKKWKKSHLDIINVPKLFSALSYQEYCEKVKNKQIHTSTMSANLINRTPKAPVLVPLTSFQSSQTTSLSTDTNGWTTVGSKKLENVLKIFMN